MFEWTYWNNVGEKDFDKLLGRMDLNGDKLVEFGS